MFNNHIKTMLVYFVAIMIGLIAILSFTVIVMLHKITSSSNYEHSITDQVVSNLAIAKFETVQIQQFLTDSAATGEDDGVADAELSQQKAIAAARKLRELDSSLGDDVASLEANITTLFNTGKRMVAAYRQSQAEGNAIMKDAKGFDWQSENTVMVLDRLEQKINNIQNVATTAVGEAIATTLRVTYILGALLIIIILVAGFKLHQIIFSQLGAEPTISRQLTQTLMEGDFTSPIKLASDDKNSLLYFLSGMRLRWIGVLTSLRRQSSLMVEQANSLNENAKKLTSNCALQSQSTADILSHVHELSANVDSISTDADAANRQVMLTGQVAQEAATVLDHVVSEIQGVSSAVTESSSQVSILDSRTKEIVGIVEVIKGIADQTNLLALNAAIEAARAGDLGRGFAVVADEVRTLAQRVSESTHTITAMVSDVHAATREIVESIDKSVVRVQTSVEMSQVARQSMGRISDESVFASQQVSRINSALLEQRSNTHEIANSMNQIAQVTEQNFSASEQVAKAAGQLNEFAQALSNESRYFKLE